MIKTLLIANRGEIACRIIATARRLGIETVAVCSDADASARHVRLADRAIGIGPAAPAQSYLSVPALLAAAAASGADAIHPGYGFLSENPDFAEAVIAAGLIWVGPPPEAIRAMGLKDAAKRLAEKAGVPVVPGYHGDAQDLVLLAGKAREIGYPVLIKARAGGGGKGMRLVDDPDSFAEALASARREARAAFGDDRVLVEKYIAAPRHIEVQVFADRHGGVVHLFERDCSAQRRHQKVVEEAPAPGMSPAVRSAMTSAALSLARSISYVGAGTMEFIADGSGPLRPDGFWFMEMNTRLQVEHPVTELVTGVDLVEWQLRVAAGERLPLGQEDIALTGHAVEARLYAEDPARGFLPSTGRLARFSVPPGIRLDSGVDEGDAVSPWYDPLLAKLIAHGADRADALARLRTALVGTEVAGVAVNAGFLAALLGDGDFAEGRLDTGLIAGKPGLAIAPPPTPALIARAALAAAGYAAPEGDDPWATLTGFGHFAGLTRPVTLARDGVLHRADIIASAEGAAITVDGERFLMPLPARKGFAPGHLDQPAGGRGQAAAVATPGAVTAFAAGHQLVFTVADPLARDEEAATHRLTAPMPGLVRLVRVAVGDRVTRGQPLLVLEAMKMEHSIVAPIDGVVAEIATAGRAVADGAQLVRFEE